MISKNGTSLIGGDIVFCPPIRGYIFLPAGQLPGAKCPMYQKFVQNHEIIWYCISEKIWLGIFENSHPLS